MLSADFEDIRWIAGPLACGIASFVMAMTNTVHPPGGATALLAVVDPTVAAMGWMFVAFILLGSSLMFVVAMLVNNIQREFPVFWFTPKDVGMWWRRKKNTSNADDIEKIVGIEQKVTEHSGCRNTIIVTSGRVMLPLGFVLDSEQEQMLQILRDQLMEWQDHKNRQAQLGSGSISCISEKTDLEPQSSS